MSAFAVVNPPAVRTAEAETQPARPILSTKLPVEGTANAIDFTLTIVSEARPVPVGSQNPLVCQVSETVRVLELSYDDAVSLFIVTVVPSTVIVGASAAQAPPEATRASAKAIHRAPGARSLFNLFRFSFMDFSFLVCVMS